MKKMLVVASLLGGMMLASPQFVAPVRAHALGELCWNLLPVINPVFGDVSRLRLAITTSGTTWLLSGRWNYYSGPDLTVFGIWSPSIAVSGAMARHLGTGGLNSNMLDISLLGHDAHPSSDFRFHASIDSETGNGTWTRLRSDGIVLTGTLTVVPLSYCP